jgi:peptidoglycan/LPS O-acetylase OafA/YrhL
VQDAVNSQPDVSAPRPPRLVYLDAIRALAALYVVLHHIYITVYPGYPVNTGPWFLSWLMFGQLGVAVFIVVSGFSLSLLPARQGYRMTGGLRRFFSRRAWRIIPPYWAAIVASVLLVLLINLRIHDPVSTKGVIVHFLLLQDILSGASPNGAFWSIAVEWQLYFVFPLFLLARRHLGSVVTAVGAALGIWAVYVLAVEVHGFSRLLHLSPQFAALFVFGILAAQATVHRPQSRHLPWGWITLGAFALLVAGCLWMGTPRALGDLYWYDLLAGAAMATGLAALASGGAGVVQRALERGPLVSVGRYSYSLYLTHGPILLAIWVFVVHPMHLAVNAEFLVMLAVCVPVALAAAYGFFLAFERPFLRRRSFAALVPSWRRGTRSVPAGEVEPAAG